jgi:hypothetical protein
MARVLLLHQQAEIQAGGATAEANDLHADTVDLNSLEVKQLNP